MNAPTIRYRAAGLHPRTRRVIAARETYKLRSDLAACRNARPGDPRPLAQIATLIDSELVSRDRLATIITEAVSA